MDNKYIAHCLLSSNMSSYHGPMNIVTYLMNFTTFILSEIIHLQHFKVFIYHVLQVQLWSYYVKQLVKKISYIVKDHTQEYTKWPEIDKLCQI